MNKSNQHRNKSSVRIPSQNIDQLMIATVGAYAFALYTILKYHANNKTGKCYPSTKRIKSLSGMDRDTIRACRMKLRYHGYISYEFVIPMVNGVKKRGRYEYTILK